MKIRRFYSHNVRSALKQVTETFGEEAAILSNKKVDGGVEIIAALDYDESLMPSSPEEIAVAEPVVSDEVSSYEESRLGLSSSTQSTPSTQSAPTKSENKPTAINEPSITKENLTNLHLSHTQNKQAEPRQKVEWSMDPSLQAMKEELELMRSMMSDQLKGIAWNRFTEKDPLKAMIMKRLSELGLTSETVNYLVPYIDAKQDIECCWQTMLATLAKSIPVAEDELLLSGGTYAFVGPTGVGKTTTIAKLAARFIIKHGIDSIALISTDNYRITAQEQLSTFGRILKIPTARVTDKTSLEFLLKKFADKKLILIDTAGVSTGDSDLDKQLKDINLSKRPIKKLLLMSATSQAAVLQQSFKLFSQISPNALVITKLDEAASLGEILSVVLNTHCPVVYTTDGQKIPEDIRVAKSYHLVSKAVWLSNKYARESEAWGLVESTEHAKLA
jgi:flagellar biosynthesis protein FlhF